MDTLTPGYANARAVLGFVYNRQFDEPIIPLEYGSSHNKVKKNNNLLVQSGNTKKQGYLNNLNNLFNIYPNPANTEVTIQYSLDPTIQIATFDLYDMVGNKISSWTLLPSQTSVNENIAGLRVGIYTYNITNNSNVLQRGKLVIIR